MADREQQAVLVDVAFAPEHERAVRAVILGSALGLLLALAAGAGARHRQAPCRRGGARLLQLDGAGAATTWPK